MAHDQAEPKTIPIILSTLATLLILHLTLTGLMAYYQMQLQEEEFAIGALPNRQVVQLHAEEAGRLDGPPGLDTMTSYIFIPIDEAKRLEAERPWRPNTPRPVATPTPAAPTPAAGTPQNQ